MSLEDPTGYGRIIKDQNRVKIVEERDATESEKKIKEVNTGIIVTLEKVIKDNIGKINNNNQKGEYYLTDIVELASLNNQVGVYHMANSIPVIGVNDLNALNSLQEKVKNNWQNDENVVK
jgi:bifunctional UDP-N-acetylglucosamine pyrophosphorylase/glucosamine-1-phosphate N-acetyltransferase